MSKRFSAKKLKVPALVLCVLVILFFAKTDTARAIYNLSAVYAANSTVYKLIGAEAGSASNDYLTGTAFGSGASDGMFNSPTGVAIES